MPGIGQSGALATRPRWMWVMTYSHENITATAAQSVPSSNGWEVKNWETGTWDTPLPAGVSLLGWIEEAIGWPCRPAG